MMPPLCVLIVGPARSGASITAAVCQELGVVLPADSLAPDAELNPLGGFESQAWNALNREVRDQGHVPTGDQVRAYDDLIDRDTARPVWGVKDAALCYTLGSVRRRVRAAGQRMAIVACHRPFRPTAASRARHSAYGDGPGYSRQQAEGRQIHERHAFYEALAQADADGAAIHHLDYEQLVDNTFREVDRLAEFLFGDHYRAEDVADAACLVRPELRHFTSKGLVTALMPAVAHG